MLVPVNCKNFLQYPSEVFIPYICRKAVNIQRIDVVWDSYFQDSWTQKQEIVQESAQKFSVMEKYQVIVQFLRCSDNKKELLAFVSIQLVSTKCQNCCCCTTNDMLFQTVIFIQMTRCLVNRIDRWAFAGTCTWCFKKLC